jgi:hypothetical protein
LIHLHVPRTHQRAFFLLKMMTPGRLTVSTANFLVLWHQWLPGWFFPDLVLLYHALCLQNQGNWMFHFAVFFVYNFFSRFFFQNFKSLTFSVPLIFLEIFWICDYFLGINSSCVLDGKNLKKEKKKTYENAYRFNLIYNFKTSYFSWQIHSNSSPMSGLS